MKVLHLPANIASQISVTVRGLRRLAIDARGLSKKVTNVQDYTGVETMDWTGRLKPGMRLVRGIRWRTRMIRAMAWADVIHWHWGDSTWREKDLKIAAWLNKPRLVEFWGDDIRDPQLASRDNPFLARMYSQYWLEDPDKSRRAQAMFKRYGFECLIPGHELSDYLRSDVFSTWHQTNVRVMTDKYLPRYPAADCARPVITHAPSDKLKKGTEAVIQTMEKLAREYPFTFRLIHQVARPEALKMVGECDLFLDQFTLGAEGLASYEAMALGKPVVCYIKPAWQARYPADFPIVMADQNNLEAVLRPLLKDGRRRHELGRLSRQYVEKYHDAQIVAAGLVKVYEQMLQKRK